MDRKPGDPAFAEWLDELARERSIDIDFNGEGKAWIREIFKTVGPLSAVQVTDMLRAHRHATAAQSLELVRRDLGRTGCHSTVTLEYDPSASDPEFTGVYLGVIELVEIDPQESAREVADAMQTILADERHLVWPLCPTHGLGLHPRIVEARAQWHCVAEGHTAAAIGSLGAPRARRH
jgi:hypothetical protein